MRNKSGFSLLEVAIVTVIIGLLIAGVVGSRHIIKKARINSAQAATRSSPINGVKGNRLWLETSLDDLSFGNNLSNGDTISSWENNANNQNKVIISVPSGASGPTYSNSINGVQAAKFSDSNYLQIDNAQFLNGTDYTIIIVDKRVDLDSEETTDQDQNYLLGEDGSFAIGYESNTKIIQSHGEGESSTNIANIEPISSYNNKPRTIAFTHSSSQGNKIYINGTLANEDTSDEAKAHLTGLSNVFIGKGYNGEIGEIAIFERDIKNSERKEIEDHLTEKWNAPNNRDLSSDCTSSVITSTGCQALSCSYTVYGAEFPTGTVSDASGTISCGTDDNFAGTDYTYSCSGGNDINANCACASGYTYNSSTNVCEMSCSYTVYGATVPTGSVSDASGTISCGTDDNFAGTDYTYSCSGGSDITANCACATGYEYNSSSNTCTLAPVASVASYSIGRKIVNSYSGNAVRLRKNGSSPGEQDFGFDSNGDLDTSAIASWLGSDTAWVTKLYDQSGNGYDFVQTNTSRQAKYAENFGSNNKPTLDCTGIACTYVISSNITDFDFTDNFSFSFALATDGGTGYDYLWTKNNSKNIEVSIRLAGLRMRTASSTLFTTSAFSGAETMVTQIMFDKNASSPQLTCYSNGSLIGQASKTTPFSVGSGATYLLGNLGINNEWRGKISEVVIHGVTLTGSERSDIQSSMSSYYGI